MSRHNLQYLLAPRSVAVIGASDLPGSVGGTVMSNLLHGGFRGSIWPVSLRHTHVAGISAYRTPLDLPAAPDLAVVCTPATTVPALIDALGTRGTHAAVVLSAGLEASAADGPTPGALMVEAARRHALRILGPDCMGLQVPGIGLNASLAHVAARPGGIAFVTQSGALMSALLDWAQSADVGFSHCISLGKASDVDFGDLLDYLGKDAHTDAILLYIESVTGARKFMSAARAAARDKPIIAVKAGRAGEAARAAAAHCAGPAGADAVYEAALRRAGVLRVRTTRQLFEAAENLAYTRLFRGPRLGIVSNGGGPAVMAADALIEGGGTLAALAAETVGMLSACLPSSEPHANPVDIGDDAPPERYTGALAAVLRDPNVDALLVIHAPTSLASTQSVASACAPLFAQDTRPMLACWLGTEGVADATMSGRKAPGFATPEEAVEAFLQLVRYHQAQALLLETPPSLPLGRAPDVAAVRTIVAGALAAGRTMLTESESSTVLAAYGIPLVDTPPVARERSGSHALLAGIATDPAFGPVIFLGQGGTGAGVSGERALALPPLNATLARELIERTPVWRLPGAAHGAPMANLAALEATLVKLAQLAIDVAEISELEITLLAGEEGAVALDARVRLAPCTVSAAQRLAIRPYPSELEETLEHRGRRLVLRPIRPEDTPTHRQFLARVSREDLYTRFFSGMRQLPDRDLAHLTQIDYDREMAFVAVREDGDEPKAILGVARACADPDNVTAEFAVLVRSDLKRQGLGTLLVRKLIDYCRARGTRELWGWVMCENAPMLQLARNLGFRLRRREGNLEEIALDL